MRNARAQCEIGCALFIRLAAVWLLAALIAGCTREAPPVSFALANGERVTMQSLRGRTVWLEFWSLTCAPCIEELPTMRKLVAELDPENVAVIAVAMPWDPPAQVVEFAQREKIGYPVALDIDEKISSAFDVTAVPHRVLIGQDGTIVRRESGRLDATAWRERVRNLTRSH
jgi:peroxiredoxin